MRGRVGVGVCGWVDRNKMRFQVANFTERREKRNVWTENECVDDAMR